VQPTKTDYPCLFFCQGQTELPQPFAQYLIKPLGISVALKDTYKVIGLSVIVSLPAMPFHHFLKPFIQDIVQVAGYSLPDRDSHPVRSTRLVLAHTLSTKFTKSIKREETQQKVNIMDNAPSFLFADKRSGKIFSAFRKAPSPLNPSD
jgi:hypothetical protein